MTVTSLMDRLQSEADAYEMLEELRWGGQPRCAHCGATRVYFLQPRDGSDSRSTRTGSRSERRVWKCGVCRRQFSVLTGTIFHGSKIPVRTWIMLVFELCSNKNGLAAREVERKYGLTPKSAWFALHRIREAMKREPLAGMLRGTVMADETYIGGSEKNKHKSQRDVKARGRSMRGKAIVLSLVNRESGEVRSAVVPNVTAETLRKNIEQHVDPMGSVLVTDTWTPYMSVGRQFEAHHMLNHSSTTC